MKKIGILGGVAPESTLDFYRRLVNLAQDNLPDREYPPIIIYSLNMAEFREPMRSGKKSEAVSILTDGIESLSKAGADFAFIASNTPHMFFDKLVERSPIPLLSMVEEVVKEADKQGFTRLGLFGTGFTMSGGFYEEVAEKSGISVFTPEEDADYIDQKTMGELANGKIVKSTQKRLVEICQRMVQEADIQALILGSTELSLILGSEVLGLPVLDANELCVEAAFDYSCE